MKGTLVREQALRYLVEALFSVALAIYSTIAWYIRKLSILVYDSRAAGWSMINAKITTGDVNAWHARGFEYAVGQIGYAYEVDGEYYSGFFQRQFFDEQKAWSFVDQKQGSAVMVRYKQSNPQVSLLRQADQLGGF
jgi:hypothetical protein